jgi:hypothetical protein
MTSPTIQVLLTYLCTAIEIGSFIFFSYRFVADYPRLSAEYKQQQLSNKVEQESFQVAQHSIPDRSSATPSIEQPQSCACNKNRLPPLTSATHSSVQPSDEWFTQLFNDEPAHTDQSSPTPNPQAPQFTTVTPNQIKGKRSNNTDHLRQLCTDHNITWRNARGNGKHLTVAQMIQELQRNQVDLSSLQLSAKARLNAPN